MTPHKYDPELPIHSVIATILCMKMLATQLFKHQTNNFKPFFCKNVASWLPSHKKAS
jgi:hypothetical protein